MQTPVEILAEIYPELITYDGFDDAIIGVATVNLTMHVVYDEEKVLKILQEQLGSTYDEAVEYFEFNIAGAYVGISTPSFYRELEDEIDD
jgi:hypothetical protein